MRVNIPVAVLAAVVLLSACKEEKVSCTLEEAEKKVAEFTVKMQEMAATNPEKMVEVGKKAQEMQGDLANIGNDPAKACAAVDQLIEAMN